MAGLTPWILKLHDKGAGRGHDRGGIDDSEGARAALAWAARQASTTGSALRVVHAYDLQIAWIDEYNEHIPRWQQQARDKALCLVEKMIDDTLTSFRPDPIDVHVAVGKPADVLHEESSDAALLVVGSRGRGGFKGLLLGSVSQRVVQQSECPVVIVPTTADETHEG